MWINLEVRGFVCKRTTYENIRNAKRNRLRYHRIERNRGYGGNQKMLVEGHRLPRLGGILSVGVAVPVREGLALRRDVLAVVALGERTAAATCLHRHAYGKALVASRREQRGLGQPRTSRHHALAGINLGNAFSEIKAA